MALHAPLGDDGVGPVSRVDGQRVDLLDVNDRRVVLQVFEDRLATLEPRREGVGGERELDQHILGAEVGPGAHVLAEECVEAALEDVSRCDFVAHGGCSKSIRVEGGR